MQQKQKYLESILIVDDKPDNLRLLAKMLEDQGYRIRPVASGSHALTTTRKEIPDLILLDVMMPGMDGYEICRILKADEHTNDIPVIFLSALNELEDKIRGFEAGGVDYITKPFHEKEVIIRVETHLKIRRLQRKREEAEQQKLELIHENAALKTSMQDRYKFCEIIGRSEVMQTVYGLISKAAASDFSVVIYGESGTGKELTAKTIHHLSGRKDSPFITVNCGAVTESIFEREFFGHRKGAFTNAVRDEPGFLDAANGGTLFLDELGELSLAMQVKLLRVLESGEYTPVGGVSVKKADIRILVATNKDLSHLVSQGKFREDLFYRINVIQIEIPPLRERREDILLLVEDILVRYKAEDKMAELPIKLREMMYYYDWPGNIRELINTIQRFLATDSVTMHCRRQIEPENPSLDGGLQRAIESLERKLIIDALRQTSWRRIKTAELLQIPRRSLLRKMKKYDLRPPDFISSY